MEGKFSRTEGGREILQVGRWKGNFPGRKVEGKFFRQEGDREIFFIRHHWEIKVIVQRREQLMDYTVNSPFFVILYLIQIFLIQPQSIMQKIFADSTPMQKKILKIKNVTKP